LYFYKFNEIIETKGAVKNVFVKAVSVLNYLKLWVPEGFLDNLRSREQHRRCVGC